MNIIIVGNFGHGWDGSICDEEHIARSLEELGHTIHRFQREETRNAEWKLIAADFALIAQWDQYHPDLIRRLKFYTEKVVYWAFDHQEHGQSWHMRLVDQADLYLSKRLADQEIAKNWQWFSQDFYPADMYKHTDVPRKDIDVLFTGTYLDWATERNETLKTIDDLFELTIHSVNPEAWTAAGFTNVGGPVMDSELPALIARTKINISIDHTIEAGYWSDRTAQIMACGGFVLMRYVPMAEVRFQDGVEFFYNTGHALDLIAEWLDKDFERTSRESDAEDYAGQYLSSLSRVQDLITVVRGIL